MCLEKGHNYRQCNWYWAWLVTPGCCTASSLQDTLDSVPSGMDEHLVKYKEVMALALHLDLPLDESIQIGISIIAGTSTTKALVRLAERLERTRLGVELGHPRHWDTMDLNELRTMAEAHRRGNESPRANSETY